MFTLGQRASLIHVYPVSSLAIVTMTGVYFSYMYMHGVLWLVYVMH